MATEQSISPTVNADWCDVCEEYLDRRLFAAYTRSYSPSFIEKTSLSHCNDVDDVHKLFDMSHDFVPDILFCSAMNQITLMHCMTTGPESYPGKIRCDAYRRIYGCTRLDPIDDISEISSSLNNTFTVVTGESIDPLITTRTLSVRKEPFTIETLLLDQWNKTIKVWNSLSYDTRIPPFRNDKDQDSYQILPFILCPPSLSFALLQVMKVQRKQTGGYANSFSPRDILHLAVPLGYTVFPEAFSLTHNNQGLKPNIEAGEQFIKYITPIIMFCSSIEHNDNFPIIDVRSMSTSPYGEFMELSPFGRWLRESCINRLLLNYSRHDNVISHVGDMEVIRECGNKMTWRNRYQRLFPQPMIPGLIVNEELCASWMNSGYDDEEYGNTSYNNSSVNKS